MQFLNFRTMVVLVSFILLKSLTAEITVSPTDDKILYVGRFDRSKAAGPRCSWPASRVTLHFQGTGLDALLNTTSEDFIQVVVDGSPTAVLELKISPKRYVLASDLSAGGHTVDLIKRTESHVGVTQFRGFFLPEGSTLLPAIPLEHRIEVIGDSISCGFGNEAPNKEEPFKASTENAYLTYGAIAARELKADYVCVAWSGKKLWPDNTIVEYYNRTLAMEPESIWGFKEQIPQVVVINLGTNDFRQANPDEEGWVSAYKTFIGEVRKSYPEVHVYCALGTMMGDYPADRKPRSTIIRYVNRVVKELSEAGDQKVHLIDFGIQKPENGIGACWHPSVKTQIEMGNLLKAQIVKDLSW